MPVGGVERIERVEQRDDRAAQCPIAATADRTAASAGMIAAIASQTASPRYCGQPYAKIASSGGARKVSAMPAVRRGKQQRRIAKLRVGRARDHPPDVGEASRRDGCCARARSGRARSGRPPSTSRPASNRRSRRCGCCRCRRRCAAHRRGPACSRRPPPPCWNWAGRPRRTGTASGRNRRRPARGCARRGSRSAASPSARSARSRQPSDCATSQAKRVGRMHDVGVGEQQIIRPRRLGGGDALLQRPQLAGPAGAAAPGWSPP